jgi:hypothetical protein
MRYFGIAALAAVCLAGCAGRDAQQISTVQVQDTTSDCAMITAEIQANNKRAESLASEQGLKVAQNVAAGVVGIVVWPVLFAMDTKGAAATEIDALKARQEYLSSLAKMRCAPPVAAAAPIAAASAPGRTKPAARPVAAGPGPAAAPATPGT